MGNPAIFNGRRTKLLTADGLLTKAGAAIDNDGLTNFVANGHFEANITGWFTYADAALPIPVNGIGGPPNVTIARTTTNPLLGTASLQFVKDAANRQGQGFSYDFTIDRAFRAQPLEIKAQVELVSGTYESGTTTLASDMIVYIYDVTNNRLIEPTGFKIQPGLPLKANFQSSPDSTSYRLIFHVSSTSAAAYTLNFDGIAVSPVITASGFAASDWQAYTPTLSAGFGTTSGVNFRYRRMGDMLEVNGTFVVGTVSSVIASVTLPSGLVLDTAKISLSNNTSQNGQAFGRYDHSEGLNNTQGNIVTAPVTSLTAVYLARSERADASSLVPAVVPDTTASGTTMSIWFAVPIAGWSSNTVASSETDVRVVNFSGSFNTLAITANVTNLTATTEKDTHGAWTGSTYVVKVPGDYQVFASAYTTTGSSTLRVWVNGVADKYLGNAQVSSVGSGAATIENLKTGDIISIRGTVNATIANDVGQGLSITRISGPAQITVGESITAAYFCSANRAGSTTAPINFDTKRWDSHNAVTTGVGWRFTAPEAGEYALDGFILGSTAANYNLYVNGTVSHLVGGFGANYQASTLAGSIMLRQGEFIDIRPSVANTVSGGALSVAAHITITKVGNYV